MTPSFTGIIPATDGGSVSLAYPPLSATYTPPSLAPANAKWSGPLELIAGNWKVVHDAGTPGTSSANPPTLPSPCGALFAFSYTSGGGTRWSVPAATDTAVSNFLYDTWIWIDNPSLMAELELDVNHVLPNGNTVIEGIQWSPSNKCWMYTTMPGGKATWNKSNIAAAVTDFQPKTWYHIQLASHHDAAGNAYYDSVTINGATRPFQNCSGPSSAALGWTPIGLVLLNAQVNGVGASGAFNPYFSSLQVARW